LSKFFGGSSGRDPIRRASRLHRAKPLGSFFAPGHDKRAESKLIAEVFGDVAHFLAAFGRAPVDAKPAPPEHVDAARAAKLEIALVRLDELRHILLAEAEVEKEKKTGGAS
jgi:hypothetical protein